MSIVVRDLTPDFMAFAAAAAQATAADRERLWRQRYVERHPEVFDAYTRGHPPVGARLHGLLADLCHQPDRLRARAEAVRELAPTALAAAAAVLGADPATIHAQAIILVGLFGANGWVDELAGRPELFVAVERVPDDARHLRLLLTHEAAHVVHLRQRTGPPWPPEGIAAGLLTEGLAVDVSAQAVPGCSPAEYLWFAGGHQTWLADCRRQRAQLVRRLLADLDATDPDTCAVYFQMRDSDRRGGLPLRSGYLIGWEVVRWLRRTYPVAAISAWDHLRATAEVRAALSAMAG